MKRVVGTWRGKRYRPALRLSRKRKSEKKIERRMRSRDIRPVRLLVPCDPRENGAHGREYHKDETDCAACMELILLVLRI